MSSSISNVNYIDTFFEFKELTKIHGEPTFESIKLLHNQLKANANSVPSTLGGGAHGHLGLVLPPTLYNLISNTPFVRPAMPAPVQIPNNNPSQHLIRTLREQHKDDMHVFTTCNGVDAALRQQIVAAIDDQYLSAIRNSTTNSITRPVYEIIFDHLYETYGEIDIDTLDEHAHRVRTMNYDAAQPINDVFTAVDDLLDVAVAADAPYSAKQAINFAYGILKRNGRFVDALTKWEAKTPQQRTWGAFKTHFTEAHKILRKVTNKNLASTPEYQQAQLVSQMVFSMVQEQMQQNPPDSSEVTQTVSTDSDTPQSTAVQYQPPVDHQANAAVHQQQDYLPLILQQMQQMQTFMQQMSMNQQNNNFNPTWQQPNNQFNGGGPNKRQKKYCWTHGWCFHDGKECTRKAQGHQDAATITNRMNGSSRGVNNYHRNKQNNGNK